MKKYCPLWEGVKFCAVGAALTVAFLVPTVFLFFIHILEGWAAVVTFLVCAALLSSVIYAVREIGKQLHVGR